MGYLFDALQAEGVGRLFAADSVDWSLERRLRRECSERGIELRLLSTPNFIAAGEEALASLQYFWGTHAQHAPSIPCGRASSSWKSSMTRQANPAWQ